MLSFTHFTIIEKHKDGTVSDQRCIGMHIDPETNGIQEVLIYLKTMPDVKLESGWEVVGVVQTLYFQTIEKQIKDKANAVHSDF